LAVHLDVKVSTSSLLDVPRGALTLGGRKRDPPITAGRRNPANGEELSPHAFEGHSSNMSETGDPGGVAVRAVDHRRRRFPV
jgi:hypothetical protein